MTLFLRANFFILLVGINNVTLLGRVGADPQKRGSSEHPVIIFSLATHTNYKYETGNDLCNFRNKEYYVLIIIFIHFFSKVIICKKQSGIKYVSLNLI